MKKRRRFPCAQSVQRLESRTLLSFAAPVPNSAVVMNTSLGEVAIQLDTDGTVPVTVANFLSYVNAGTYNGTIFHRVTYNGDNNQDSFGVVQGGGFTGNNGTLTPVTPTGGLGELSAGTIYSSLTLSGALTTSALSAGTIPAGTTLTLTSSSDGNTQNVVLSSDANVGDTSLNVVPFTVTDTFPGGSSIQAAGTPISALAGIVNEFTDAHPDSVGTIAMARTSGLNSATSEFFFNTTDNSSIFGDSNPFAAFGTVIRGLGVLNTVDFLSTNNSVAAPDGETLNPPETNTGAFVTINSATEEDTLTVAIGPNDAAGDKSVTFIDPTTKSKVTISLANADATLTFTGTSMVATPHGSNVVVTGTNLQLQEINSTDSTAKSALKIAGKSSNLGNINITGSINSITGSAANLSGDINVSGGVNTIKLGSTSAGGIISLDTSEVANAATTTISIPLLSDISIESGGAIKSLSAKQFVVDDGTSRELSTNGPIAKVQITGNMEAAVFSNAAIGSIKAANMTDSIGGVTINSVTLGSFQNGYIYANGAYNAQTLGLTQVKITGAVSNAEIVSVGNIGSIQAGSLSGTAIIAGYDSSGNNSPTDNFQYPLAANATLQSVKLTAPKSASATSFSDSQIDAYQIDSLALGRIATTNSGNLTVTGLQSHNIKSLATATDKNQSLNLSNITDQTTVNAQIAKANLDLGDFTIDVI